MAIDRLTATIRPVAPFNFELTAGYHTYFQSRYGTDTMEDGVYRRLLDLGDKLVLASVRSSGTVDAPELSGEVGLQRGVSTKLVQRLPEAQEDLLADVVRSPARSQHADHGGSHGTLVGHDDLSKGTLVPCMRQPHES